ncbi:oligosaccharide flippase family protein [Sphaerotilus natans]|uniref:oligosaccharide flippase family protein n=1 Tax=Sphaerotilus natans TaxID=34103 RepID=UPI00406BE92B
MAKESKYLFAAKFLSIATGIISSILLGRLIGPSDYGVIAVAGIFISFANNIKEFGVQSLIIKSKNMDDAVLNMIFRENMKYSLFLLFSMIFIAAIFFIFKKNEISLCLFVMAISVFLVSSSNVHCAIEKKRLNFKKIMQQEVILSLGGLLLTLFFVVLLKTWLGVVIGQLISSVFFLAYVFCCSSYKVSLETTYDSSAIISELKKITKSLIYYNSTVYLSNQFMPIAFAVTNPVWVSGNLNRAQQLLNISGSSLMQPITQAVLPELCRRSRNDAKNYYIDTIKKTSTLMSLIGGCVFLFGQDLTLLLIGRQWSMAGAMFEWFGLCIFASGLAGQTGNVFIYCGKEGFMRKWGIFDSFVRISASAFGLMYGPVEACMGFSVATLFVTTPVVLGISARFLDIRLLDLIGAIKFSLVVMMATAAFSAFGV